MPPFADHGANGAATQRFFHRPQELARPRGGDRDEPFGREAEAIKTAAAGGAAFAERHVLGDPADAGLQA